MKCENYCGERIEMEKSDNYYGTDEVLYVILVDKFYMNIILSVKISASTLIVFSWFYTVNYRASLMCRLIHYTR